MYSSEDEQQQLYLASSAETQVARCPDSGNGIPDFRTNMDESSGFMMLRKGGDRHAMEAMSNVLIAREQTRSQVGVAECLVRIKELDAMANVEMARLSQTGETERCRIKEDNQTSRSQRLAAVTEMSIKETATTKRQEVTETSKTKREAIAVHERVETLRIKTSEWKVGGPQGMILVFLLGTFSARISLDPTRGPRRLGGWLIKFSAGVAVVFAAIWWRWRALGIPTSDLPRVILHWLFKQLWAQLSDIPFAAPAPTASVKSKEASAPKQPLPSASFENKAAA